MGVTANLVTFALLLTFAIAVLLICDLNVILLDGNKLSVVSSARSKLFQRDAECAKSPTVPSENESAARAPEFRCNCSDPVISVCPPRSPVQVVEKPVVVKEIVKQQGPWYAEGRTWHYPVKFPRCSMDVCFNYSKCDNMQDDLLIYAYDLPYHPQDYYPLIGKTKWFTTDPERACLFFVFLDARNQSSPHPRELPYWNGGMNHVLVSLEDRWTLNVIPEESIGFASLLISDMHETIYRPGFDVSGIHRMRYRMMEFQKLTPFERKYFLTFRGTRYTGDNEGTLRSYDSFREMHNGNDVIVATTCKHPRRFSQSMLNHCDEDALRYANFSYRELMNSTFGLVPAGRQPSTYRFTEVLSAGGIPVLIADNYVKPYDTLVQWHKCILQFPSTEIQRILPTLRQMNKEETERRQEYCLKVYKEYFRDDEALLKGAVDSLKVRFMGVYPNLTPLTEL